MIFWDFLDFFSGVGWTGELWSNCVFLILRNKEDFVFIFLLKIIFFKTFGFLKKCDFFLKPFFLDFRFFLHIFKMLYLVFLMNSLEFLFRCFLDFLRFFNVFISKFYLFLIKKFFLYFDVFRWLDFWKNVIFFKTFFFRF